MKPNRKQQIKNNLKGKKQRGPKNLPPESLTASLNYPQAKRIANEEARAESQPAINAIKSDISGSRNRQHQINEWFQGLGNQIAQSAQATDQSYAAANNALTAHAQAAANAALAQQGQIQAGNQQMIGLTGADASLTAPIEAEGAGAANARQIAFGALSAPIAQAGASQAAYLRNTGINARREGIQQKQNEMRRRDLIKKDLTSARTRQAQLATQNLYGPQGLRNNERDYRTQRAAFGLEKKTAAQQAANDAANLQLDQANAAQDIADANIKNNIAQQNANTAAKNAASTAYNAHHQGGKDGLTPSEQRGVREGKHNAAVTAKNLYTAAEHKPKSDAEWAAFTQLVAQEEEISPTEAQRAVRKLREAVEPGGINHLF